MTPALDPVIHPTHRLRICALVAAAGTVELSVVKTHLDLSPSALSKQVAALVDAGYITQQRAGRDSRRVWLTLTSQGRHAYRAHVAALQEIVAAGPGSGASDPEVGTAVAPSAGPEGS